MDHGIQARRPKASKYDLIHIPFEGVSTYGADFDPKARIANDPRPKAPEFQSVNLENYTTYAVDFVPKPFGKKAGKGCCEDQRHSAVHSGRLAK